MEGFVEMCDGMEIGFEERGTKEGGKGSGFEKILDERGLPHSYRQIHFAEAWDVEEETVSVVGVTERGKEIEEDFSEILGVLTEEGFHSGSAEGCRRDTKGAD